MLIESSGEYKQLEIKDPSTKVKAFPISSVCTYYHGGQAGTDGKGTARQGFIVAGESGQMRVFYKVDNDNR